MRSLLLLPISTLATLGILELALRWWGVLDAPSVGYGCYRFSDNPRLLYETIPRCLPSDTVSVRAGDAAERLNSLGMRDAEPTDAAHRIAVIGDSITYGPGVPMTETWPKLLERRLPGVGVLNFAVPGYATEQEVETLRVKGLAYDPDTVIVQYYMNDDDHFNLIFQDMLKSIKETPRNQYLLSLDRGWFARSRLLMFVRLALHPSGANDWEQGSVYTSLIRLRQMAAGRGMRVLVLIFPHAYGAFGLADLSVYPDSWVFDTRTITNICRELGLRCVNMAQEIHDRPRLARIPGRRLFMDGCCHLTPFGHRLAAWIAYRRLGEAVVPRGYYFDAAS